MSLHYLVQYPSSKNCHAEEVFDANCHVRLSQSKIVLKYFSDKISTFYLANKKCPHQPYEKSYDHLYTTAATKIKMPQQNAVHSQQSVSH